MKQPLNPERLPAVRLLAASAIFSLLLPSCLEDKDPSYEKEALKLSAEKAALEVRLEESKKQIEELRTQVRQAEAQVDAIKEKASEASGKIDPEKIKLGFAKAMADLEKQIETNFPHLGVKSWTVQKMNVQTDYPFSSGVMTTLVNKSTGETQDKYWEAKGNVKGEWLFEQKAGPAPRVVRNPPAQPTGPGGRPSTTAGNPPAQPAQPAQPRQPAPARPKPKADGKTHIIDWGTLR